jgi:hypothetical protein
MSTVIRCRRLPTLGTCVIIASRETKHRQAVRSFVTFISRLEANEIEIKN